MSEKVDKNDPHFIRVEDSFGKLVQRAKEKHNLTDKEVEILHCDIDLGELERKAEKITQKGGVNRMTEKMTLEQFGNVVKFCEQKYALTPEEVKIVVMEFSEGQLKELSNVSEKARVWLKQRFGCTPFEFIRFNEPGSAEELNKRIEQVDPDKK